MRSNRRETTERPKRDSRPVTAIAMWLAATAFAVLACQTSALASPYDYISVGDPIEEELRILDMLSSAPLRDRIRLPHLLSLPVQPIELQGNGPPLEGLDPVRAISLARIERALGRDRGEGFVPDPLHRSTPRLIEHSADSQFLEFSTGFEGRGEFDHRDSQFASGSGFAGRIGVALDQLLAYSRITVGRVDEARSFSDAILPRTDFIVLTEETYLAYSEPKGQWGIQFGQSKWHWGPGEEGSLVLSKTSPSLTGLFFRVRIDQLRADAMALSATLRVAAGEQLAAHRIEWQLADGLRVGVTEAARYRATGWRPLYVMGAIPYVLVQRLEQQKEPDSLLAVRNNIITAADFTWRIAEGLRLYGELMVDDVSIRTNKTPDKLAYQAGIEGVGQIGATRLMWGTELTRVSRFVYTSFFGRDHQTQGTPLGFPVAPDSRRVRVRANWDFVQDWQLRTRVIFTEKGENDLDEPFVPPGPAIDTFDFEGFIETTRELQVGIRWWPASGVDLETMLGYRWVDNEKHVPGVEDRGVIGALQVRLKR